MFVVAAFSTEGFLASEGQGLGIFGGFETENFRVCGWLLGFFVVGAEIMGSG